MYKKNEAKRFTLRCVLYQQVGVPRDTQLMSVWCILNGPAIPPLPVWTRYKAKSDSTRMDTFNGKVDKMVLVGLEILKLFLKKNPQV